MLKQDQSDVPVSSPNFPKKKSLKPWKNNEAAAENRNKFQKGKPKAEKQQWINKQKPHQSFNNKDVGPRTHYKKNMGAKKKFHDRGSGKPATGFKKSNLFPKKIWDKGTTQNKVNFHNQKAKREVKDSGESDPGKNVNTLKQTKGNLQNQKNLKREAEDPAESSPNKKIKLVNLKKKERKIIRKKNDNKSFEHSKQLKALWEDLRKEDCKSERKIELVEAILKLVKGRVKEFTFAHDTVRVLECLLASGSETHRTSLFEELKDEIIPLTKSKYGKFFVIKMLRYGTKLQKDFIMKSFHGKVIELMRHTEAAEVVEAAFNECANASQRSELVQEFYGASYKFFKNTDSYSLQQLLEKNPEQRVPVIKHMKEVLLRVLEKSVVKHSLVHYVLLQFMSHCDQVSRSEIIESLRESVAEILHTKDGSRVAMHCVWYGTAKDRKAIIKSMKLFVTKIVMEEHGHMVLLSLFDCVDDTKLIEKHIVSELSKNILTISQNLHGRKVLIYLLSPRDSHFFCPDVINILKTGDTNTTSKKNPEIRHAELKSMIVQPLIKLIKSNIQSSYTDNSFCLFVLTILKHTLGHRLEAFESIAEVAADYYSPENKNDHIIEHPGSHFLLKQLILEDKQEIVGRDTYFSEVLMSILPTNVMKSWINCNRGCFLLVSLIETGIPSVVERLKEEMTGQKTNISTKSFKGAEILLKKLKK